MVWFVNPIEPGCDVRCGPMASHPTTFLPLAAGWADLTAHHRHLLDDSVRTSAFLRAIRETVRPGDIVADLGTGTGVLAIAARRAGAARVYAIDRSPIVRLARTLARHNRVDGIEWIEDDARRVVLPEPVDVILSECFGPLAIGSTMIDALASLRERYLKPGGRVIPQAVTLWLAPIDAPRIWQDAVGWTRPRYGIDWSPASALASNNLYNTRVERRAQLAVGVPLHTIDLRHETFDGTLTASTSFVTRGGRLHGFAGWFESQLSSTTKLTTAPGARDTIWRQVFLPLPQAMKLRCGSTITVTLSTTRADRDHVLWFDWRGTVDGKPFAQSTRYSVPDDRIA